MTEFHNRIVELRESIYQGNVTEGVSTLGTWLLEDLELEDRCDVLLELILLAVTCGDLEEAINRWREVESLKDVESDVRSRAYQAFFLMLNDKRKRGLAKFEDCLREEPGRFEFYLLRGIGYSQYELYEYAQADLERANSICPNNVLVMAALGDICAEQQDVKRAISLHESVLEMCPDYRRSLMSLGVLYFDMNRLDESFRLFQCLVAYDPMNWFSWTCLGDIRAQMPGRTFQALPYYAAAIVAGTEIGQTYLNLARGLFQLGKYAQGNRVLKRFESERHHKWLPEERVTAGYLSLIGDVIENPALFETADFNARFQKLKSCNDSGNQLLFKVLAELSSFTYQSDIVRIFKGHMASFVHMAQYMSICDNRVIQPEEAIMLGVLARMYIWHGLQFEARAILGMLNRAEDARVVDMTATLWNDLYAHEEAAMNAGVDIERFHEILIREHDSEICFDALVAGQKIDPRMHLTWNAMVSSALCDAHVDDFTCALFGLSYTSVFEELEDLLAQHPDERAQMLHGFWAVCEAWAVWNAVSSDAGKSDFWVQCASVLKLDGRLISILKKLTNAHKIESKKITTRRETSEKRGWKAIFSAILKHSKVLDDLPEIFVDNDNRAQVCAADPSEALSGFEPLPFALDGTAFKRFMQQLPEKTGVLDDQVLEDFWRERVVNSQFVVDRAHSSSEIGFRNDESEVNRTVADCMRIWKALHGKEPVSRSLFERDSRLRTAEMMDLISSRNTACRCFMHGELEDVLTEDSWSMPESPLISVPVLFKKQTVPTYPRAAAVLNRWVPDNFLTIKDLYEQFFNRAVYAIETWRKDNDLKALELFFEKGGFVFQKFNPEIKENSGCHMTVKKAVSQPGAVFRTPSAHNSDVEGHSRSERFKRKLKSSVHLNKAGICTTAEMAESLTMLDAWCNKQHIPVFCTGATSGCVRHQFALQFQKWAQKKAMEIWPDIAEIEASAREMESGEHYVVVWRIHDLLTRYPWLSRLYVLLAGVYARMDETEKALQTIQTGLGWEDILYEDIGWFPVHPDASGLESPLDAIEVPNEFEERQPLLWPERFVFQPRDEGMYHYGPMESGFELRRRVPVGGSRKMHRIALNDKGGCYDFYRLFKRFITSVPALMDVWLSAIREPGVYSLRDYFVYVMTNLVAPELFPLRREIAEMFFQLYPTENSGALGRFYCDNLQTANALPHAAYAYFSAIEDEAYDDYSQSTVTLGCLLYDMGYMEDAMTYLDRAVCVKNPSPMAFLTKGCALIEVRAFDEAIYFLKEGQKIDPASDRFFYNLALAYIEQGKLDDAEQAIRSGIELSKFPVDLNMQLMRIYVKKGQLIDALPLAKYVASEDPDMFVNALQFGDFDEFRELSAVQKLLDECSYGKSE